MRARANYSQPRRIDGGIPDVARNAMRPVIMILFAIFIIGCQGRSSSKPPIHLVPNMDNQPRYEPQEAGRFFPDGSAMRRPVAGTVARGALNANDSLYRGVIPGSDQPLERSPIRPASAGLERGRERYDIYCSVCHSKAGDGRGIMVKKNYPPPPTFHSELMRSYPDGHLFNVISNGVRNMPAYGPQIPEEDRWLIVNYVRALQRSQFASVKDVPIEKRDVLKMAQPGRTLNK